MSTEWIKEGEEAFLELQDITLVLHRSQRTQVWQLDCGHLDIYCRPIRVKTFEEAKEKAVEIVRAILIAMLDSVDEYQCPHRSQKGHTS